MDPSTFSPDELTRIRQQLQRSGYPLEHRVASICQAALDGWSPREQGTYINREDGLFRQEEDGTLTPIERRFKDYPAWPGDNLTYFSKRLVYRDERPGAQHQAVWREIDRELHVNTSVTLGAGPEDATIDVHCQAIIECKHREDVMLVGFVDADQGAKTSFPILGPMANTRLISNLAYRRPMPCQNLPRVTIGGVQRKGSGWHTFDENLIYKAAGSLYEFLGTDWEPWAEQEVHPFLTERGILDMIIAAQKHQFFSLRSWMQRNLQAEWIEEFNATHVRWNIVPPLLLALPIVCVDMPLMLASVDEHGGIGPLEPTAAFIADERVHSWPGKTNRVLWTHPYAENERGHIGAPVVVVHVDALMDILIELAEWGTVWHDALMDDEIDPDVVARWPLEEAILRATEHWGF
jgi:hypothetical protein